MTQVKLMTHHELNRVLTELLGYKVVKDESTGMFRMVDPQGKEFGMSRRTESLVWNDYAYPFSTEPTDSLKIQSVAIARDKVKYIQNLTIAIYGKAFFPEDVNYWSSIIIDVVVDFLTATPRQRAEAAYMTLQVDR